MPQGFSKKIEFNLLLANLAFKFDNAATGFGQCIRTTLFRRYCKARRQGLGVRRCRPVYLQNRAAAPFLPFRRAMPRR